MVCGRGAAWAAAARASTVTTATRNAPATRPSRSSRRARALWAERRRASAPAASRSFTWSCENGTSSISARPPVGAQVARQLRTGDEYHRAVCATDERRVWQLRSCREGGVRGARGVRYWKRDLIRERAPGPAFRPGSPRRPRASRPGPRTHGRARGPRARRRSAGRWRRRSPSRRGSRRTRRRPACRR
jgi:hypothetical protein